MGVAVEVDVGFGGAVFNEAGNPKDFGAEVPGHV